MYNINFTILTIFTLQFSDNKYIHIIVQLLSLSVYGTFSSSQTETLPSSE